MQPILLRAIVAVQTPASQNSVLSRLRAADQEPGILPASQISGVTQLGALVWVFTRYLYLTYYRMNPKRYFTIISYISTVHLFHHSRSVNSTNNSNDFFYLGMYIFAKKFQETKKNVKVAITQMTLNGLCEFFSAHQAALKSHQIIFILGSFKTQTFVIIFCLFSSWTRSFVGAEKL